MASAIKDTPTLTGNNAREFRESLVLLLCSPMTEEKRLELEQKKKRMKESYEFIMSISREKYF